LPDAGEALLSPLPRIEERKRRHQRVFSSRIMVRVIGGSARL
jgi:hypothetical protein